MSDKFFFNGKALNRPAKAGVSYSDKRETKPGSKTSPITVSVQTEERKAEIEAQLTEHSLFATISVDADNAENISELESLLNKPKTVILEKMPKRNDPCSCGSGKKYKKCCG